MLRFIPAHAGNTEKSLSNFDYSPVHPRACGEHSIRSPVGKCQCGSSPRMRGTRLRIALASSFDRFIPAHAGNTISLGGALQAGSVHPRACGEHPCYLVRLRPVFGSSPRMRGTLACSGLASEAPRFIPAHAGNTLMSAPIGESCPVHPRACGEHEIISGSSPRIGEHRHQSGSSPRMRGTLLRYSF